MLSQAAASNTHIVFHLSGRVKAEEGEAAAAAVAVGEAGGGVDEAEPPAPVPCFPEDR